MTNKKKKSIADLGTVLHKIKNHDQLKPWADYMVTVDPWKSLEFTPDRLLSRWTAESGGWQFFSAADPKNAKTPGFEHEHGLIVFAPTGARPIVEGFMKSPLAAELGDGGYIAAIATKVRHKGIGKYLVAAAERVVSDSHKRMFLFVSESNHAAQRFYKAQGYEEIGRALDCLKPGNTEILMTKTLD
jgi:ribosomal protein S18 acetylase RimI-like enzyme